MSQNILKIRFPKTCIHSIQRALPKIEIKTRECVHCAQNKCRGCCLICKIFDKNTRITDLGSSHVELNVSYAFICMCLC